MKEKKYIDRIYQEKFRDFEAAPRDAVWKNIETRLQKKQKRQSAVPFWYRYAGVAALLAFLFMIGDWILPVPPTATVANEERKEPATPSIAPAVVPVIPIASKEKTSIVSNTPEVSKINSPPVVSSSETTKEERKAEESTLGMKFKNVIFGTSVPVADLPLNKKITLPTPEELKPSIFDAVKQNEETEIASIENKSNFEVSTHVTPIYYGKIGSANPLETGFDNNREAEVTYSYGVSLAMNISENIKIRSGISRVNLSYSTSGIGYQSVAGTYPVRNASLVKVKNPDVKMVTGDISGRTRSSTNRTSTGIFTQGNLSQKMGYIEIPVEFEINLWENKFELNLIGGGSTLFLEENEVTLNTANTSAVGKADNLNELSFSANLGLGLNYNLSEKFKLNLEPMIKYQLKTFDEPTGNVQPYFFGVYSGVSYKF